MKPDTPLPASLHWTTIVPLASLTALSGLATDLYLPAVVQLPAALQTDIVQAQATLSVFMAALAVSQIVWGALVDRIGVARCAMAGVALLGLASVACALAPTIGWLIVARGLQGWGAGAATVVVPVLIRRRFDDAGSTRAMAVVAMAESMIPALGPVFGALLLSISGWRVSFALVAVCAIVLAPSVRRQARQGGDVITAHTSALDFRPLLAQRAFLAWGISHALCFAALLGFVASAPQILAVEFGFGPPAFAGLQLLGVAAFLAAASQSARLTQRHGARLTVGGGASLQLLAGALMLALAWVPGSTRYPALLACWMLFCAGLGLRGPATMTRALTVPPALMGRASGLLMFMVLGASGIAVQALAPTLHRGLWPVALALSGLSVLSIVALVPLRRPRTAATA